MWQNCGSLQEDGKRPHNFTELEVVIEDETENYRGANEVFDTEGVNGRVICWSKLDLHEVQNVAAAANEEELHAKVVQGDPLTIEHVKVASHENDDIKSLSLE